MLNEITWEPAYVRLLEELARAKITALCQFVDQYRTDYDTEEARRLCLGRSAFEYRNLDEGALVAFEADLMAPKNEEPKEPTPEERRAARNRRYYERRKQGLLAS